MIKKRLPSILESISDVSKTSPKKGTWWWWFLLLIFNNPKNKEKPRQLMILWSTKKDKEIDCNDLNIVLDHSIEARSRGKVRDGAVASWYYDGAKMHHNFLLKQTPILFLENGIKTKDIFTALYQTKDRFKLIIGDSINFNLSLKEKNDFTMPTHDKKEIFGFNYELLRMNRLELTGSINGERINGSAYFQRVFLNAPALPWYWGIFYFGKHAMLTYFKIHTGKLGEIPFKKDIRFYYKGKLHKIGNIRIKRKVENGLPIFTVTGEDEKVKIKFQVTPYSVSWWRFRKKILGMGPKSTFTWYEYPAIVKQFHFVDKTNSKSLTEKDLGVGIGNAEQSHGFMI